MDSSEAASGTMSCPSVSSCTSELGEEELQELADDPDADAGDGLGPAADDEDSDKSSNDDDDTAIMTPPPTVKKKRNGKSKKSESKVVPLYMQDLMTGLAIEPPSELEPEPASIVMYILSITSAVEFKKAVSKHELHTETLQLRTNEEWDRFKAQILVKICDTINPSPLDYTNFDIKFYIPRLLSKPGLPLKSSADYGRMIDQILKPAKLPTVNITVLERSKPDADKENDDEPKGKKTGKTVKVYPANEQKTENILKLRDKWACKRANSVCASEYCYLNPETGDHAPLSHEAINAWAMAMMRGDGTLVTEDAPPNNSIFDSMNSGRINPLLAKRKADQLNASSGSSSAPVFNFSLGEGATDLLRSFIPNQNRSSFNQAITAPTQHEDQPLLTISNRLGPDMTVSDFCKSYQLSATIEKKLTDEGYTHARMLRFATVRELKEMSFRNGEIACLKDAVERWCSEIAGE
ncbi:hypothetical protein HWV62_26945 [Athelia sp. TMB]|nr:hypothetical protein HWV62_26945 [Athelia sp. TMB]